MAAKTFHIELKKYVRLYAIFPPLLGFALYGTDMFSLEAIGFMIAAVVAMHILYYWRVYDYFVVVVADEGLQLFSLLGQKEEIAWKDLAGPLEKDFYIVKYYTFISTANSSKQLVVTSYTENLEECLNLIQSRAASAR